MVEAEVVQKSAENDKKKDIVPPKVFTIEVLRLIRDAQQQHGLRHGDYQRYRSYCSRRLARLRKVLKLQQGEKRHFKKKDVTVDHLTGVNADERFIHVPLMMAERAWSFAMQLRQEANTEPRKKFHLVNRLKKACFYALKLQELCNSIACDVRSKLEAEAYVAWMHGTLHFELGLWKKAAENLKKAQVVYENLITALPDDEQSIYKARVDELSPSLRYCSYNIGDDSSIDDLMELRGQGVLNNLDTLIQQSKSKSSDAMQTADWRGRKFTVRPARARLFLLSLQDIDKSVKKAESAAQKIEIIENMLMDCKDAILSVKDEIKQDPKLRTTETGAPISGIQFLLSYMSYIRLTRTVERNLYLVEQARENFDNPNKTIKQTATEGKRVRPQDLTRLYEIILQNVSELQQINGLEEDTGYQAELEVLSTSFKAFRCYYIALTLVALKRWKEAVAMYVRATDYATTASKANPTQFNLKAELDDLVRTIEGCKYMAHAYSVLEEDTQGDSVLFGKSQKSSKALFDRLAEYREDPMLNSKNPNVYKLTPEMQPIPCKPLFFDLALNFIQIPSLEDKIEQKGGDKKAAGISGFVKGFLGWGGANK